MIKEIHNKGIGFLLEKISTLAYSANGIKIFLESCLEPISQVMGSKYTSIYGTDISEKSLYLAASSNPKELEKKNRIIQLFGEGIISTVVKFKKEMVFDREGKLAFLKQNERISENENIEFIAPLLWYNGRILGVIQCSFVITTQKRLYNQKLLLLRQIAELLSPFMAASLTEQEQTMALERMTHELKSSLVAIKNSLQMIEHSEHSLSIKSRERINDVNMFCDMLMTSVESKSLAIGKSLIIHPENTLFYNQILMPALNMLKGRINEHEILVVIEPGVRMISELFIDRHLVMLAVYNILDNAIKYSDAHTKIVIRAENEINKTSFFFTNNGSTISNSEKDMIFNIGYRSTEAMRRNVSGQGIGLFVVKRIMEGHGGAVTLYDNNDSNEVTFRLEFPHKN
ncbi:MAG: HAMP domain-containing sensor histidine kinase [Bacteroidetes bacterium]|nr:HAMP domain-containing sensor histidine kinase [Bacteroidota bacterium]